MKGLLAKLVAFYRRESVAVGVVVTSGTALVAAFTTGLTPEQLAAITTFVAAVTGLTARSQVTPTATP